jgi:hypothetical protein
MKANTFFQPQPDRVETGLWAVITLVVLLAIALAAMPAIAPPDQPGAGPTSPPAATLAHTSSNYVQIGLHQFVADMRTLVAALRYLMESETEPTVVA